MIKNPEKFRAQQENKREKYLRGMSVEQSVRLLESLLTSGLVEEFKFSEEKPICLALSIENARKRL